MLIGSFSLLNFLVFLMRIFLSLIISTLLLSPVEFSAVFVYILENCGWSAIEFLGKFSLKISSILASMLDFSVFLSIDVSCKMLNACYFVMAWPIPRLEPEFW
jgi:hypothetical protein